MLTRVLAVAAAAAIGTAVTPTAASAAEPAPAATTNLSFIEALAAIPAATRTVTAARGSLLDASTRRASVRASLIAAEAALSQANARASETRLVATRANRAAADAHATLDATARTMYATGGSVPSLAEVLLTADSEIGFARSMLTRQYLSAAATEVIDRSERADRASLLADAAVTSAHAARDITAAAASVAESSLMSADADLARARAALEEAREDYQRLMRITRADRSAEYGRIKQCGDWLTKLLSRTGFEGEDLREAWAIVMRESGGRADAVSLTNDLGLFQINTATWKGQPWFDRKLLLTKRYNATVAHTLSKGGGTWYSWGLDGHGRPDARAYVKAGWSQERILDAIVFPYVQWYASYPCRPAGEKDLGLGLPLRPLADEGKDLALQEGDGERPSEAAVAWAFEDEGDEIAVSVAEVLVDTFAVVPALWHVELANALYVGLRRDRIEADGVQRFMDLLSYFDIRTQVASPDAGRLALASARWELTAYDSSYLLLAQERGLALATGDRALARTAAADGIRVYGADR